MPSQLAELLDVEQMRLTFERTLGCRIADCRLLRAKLRPGRNCLLTYRLKVFAPESGTVREQLVTLTAFGEGESRARLALETGNAVFHLPELDALARLFPYDRKLSGLPAIADPAKLKTHLPEIVAKAFGVAWKPATFESEVVSYAAERACTVRVKLVLENSRTGATARQTLFGKTYRPGEGETVWRAMQWLWRQPRLLIPRPLCFQPEINTLWQQGLAGKMLDAAGARTSRPRYLANAGAAVAALHRLSLPDWPLREAVSPLEALAAAKILLTCALPACQPKLQLLVDCLTDGFEKLRPRPAAILHGDLHLKNLLATGESVALLDWDNVCAGDPAQELGSFAASLSERGAAADGWLDTFIEAYRSASGWEVSASGLAWHTAAALIYERAYRHVIRLNADAPRVIDGLIERAWQLIEKL